MREARVCDVSVLQLRNLYGMQLIYLASKLLIC